MIFTSRKAMDDLLRELHDQLGDVEIEPFFDYSGRGMFGEKCIGFTTDSPYRVAMALTAILCAHQESADYNDNDNPLPEWFDLYPMTDGMGYNSVILYFPGWQIEN